MIMSRTPLRLSFFGGGTDIQNFYSTSYGAVLSTAIKKYVYVSVIRRFHKDIRIGYSKTETVNSAEEIENQTVRQVLLDRRISGQIEVDIMADVPGTGTGLGSSSALTVGLLNAIYLYQGKERSAEELAAEACDLEINQLKKPIGKQDQYASALGDMRYIRFSKDGKVTSEKVKMSENTRRDLEENMISFYIPNPNREGDKILKHQNSRLSENAKALEIMRDQAAEGRSYLEDGDLESFAKMLDKAWELKRGLSSKISNPLIDKYYKTGLKLGAIGGKLSGAGGSGFLTFLCDPKLHSKLQAEFRALEQMKMQLEKEGTRIVYTDHSD
jgi:D-glycero-alpha-D-manno-heptose-7-phosphate kinase